MDFKHYISTIPHSRIIKMKYSIELFDEFDNNIFWANADGRWYKKSWIQTKAGPRETSVEGMRFATGKNIESFSRRSWYDTETGKIIYEESSDDRKDCNVYRKKIGQETIEKVEKKVIDKGKELF